ncbi:MAG: single-stranded DNA-binding protein [Bacteroidales bacterium]|nr:single-stranded DNA-binding protein [Bacteroidales bacterium]
MNEMRLRGIVGRSEVNHVKGKQVCNFSVATDYGTVDREGNPAIETTWFNVSAWSGREGIVELSAIQVGAWIEVIGRVRVRKYTTAENEERSTSEILARTVRMVPRDNDRMQPQRD